jgi:hypothetical protein
LFILRPFLTPSPTVTAVTSVSANNMSTIHRLSSSFLMYSGTTRQVHNESYDETNLVNVLSSKAAAPQKPEIPVIIDEFCLWLGYVNSFINPFLYAFYNSAFRRGMRRLIVCKRQL